MLIHICDCQYDPVHPGEQSPKVPVNSPKSVKQKIQILKPGSIFLSLRTIRLQLTFMYADSHFSMDSSMDVFLLRFSSRLLHTTDSLSLTTASSLSSISFLRWSSRMDCIISHRFLFNDSIPLNLNNRSLVGRQSLEDTRRTVTYL